VKKRRSLISPGTWTLVVLVLAILAWEWGAAVGTVDVFFFGSPSLIWGECMEMVQSGSMARHLSATLQEAGLGLLIGGVLGTLAGLGLGISPKLSTALMPLMTGLNGLPKLALGPLVIIWFGIGLKSKVVIAVLMVFFVFAFNLYSGVNSVERELVTAVKLLGGTKKQILQKVIWPASIPWLLASLRTGLGLSISGAIVGEYLGAGQGMGWVISNAGERYDVNQVLCCVAVLVILVMLLDGVVRLLERKLLRWR
jgi:NitT/TauT family transport system permease protein